MKVRAIKRYNDLQLKRVVDKEEVFEVDEQRARYLVEQKVVAVVADAKSKAVKADGKEQ